MNEKIKFLFFFFIGYIFFNKDYCSVESKSFYLAIGFVQY